MSLCLAGALLSVISFSALLPVRLADARRPTKSEAELVFNVSNSLAEWEKRAVKESIEARSVRADLPVDAFDDPAWRRARAVQIKRYWSGANAPVGRQAEARMLWSQKALYVRFVARRGEPLVVSAMPRLDQKTIGLWERDVCEAFIAPDAAEPHRYFEFEVAPTGEWLDLRIHQQPDKRETDWQYHSGATFAARVLKDAITMTMRVPWTAFGKVPRANDRWRVNLFRCVGSGETRGYVAWQPTLAPEPNFHVPEKFGWLRFAD